MSNDNYQNPLSTKTPTMTVAAVLEWLDLEIEYLKAQHKKTPQLVIRNILEGTWLHLGVMKAQLADYTFNLMDEDTK